ncbi:MAG: hypothetical protein Q7U57_19660 [Methylovulum sp.]|nr:hypothetical protein [Methylovulum sp.]
MKKLYIHAGFGKCGSSSIQTFLSRHKQFSCTNGDHLVYAARLGNRLFFGDELLKMADQRPQGYSESLPFSAVKTATPDEYFNAVGGQLLGLLEQSHVVLSQESWSNEVDAWAQISFFSRHNIDVTFIFYIRPPVTWINSSWWQWGAWSPANLDAWIGQMLNAVKYGERIRAFNRLPWASRVHVRLLEHDLLDDFSGLVGLEPSKYQQHQSVANKSLPNGMLRLLQTHRRLRPDPHAPAVDFIVRNHLKLDGKPDWVLDAIQIKKIIDETRDSNLLLLNFIDEDCKDKFIADPQYWEVSAFDGMQAKPSAAIKPSYDELEDIALAAIDAVIKLDTQQLKAKAHASPVFDHFLIWRDLALHVENSDLELANRLMQQSAKLRPEAEFVQRKLANYQTRLARLKKKPDAK